MLTVLSPAKSLDLNPAPIKVNSTQPKLVDDTKLLTKTTAKLSQKKIATLMKISEPLAALNFERYKKFKFPLNDKNAYAAIFTFDGGVYKGLDARTLKKSDINFAQKHMAMLSGLYGILRPLDLMQPYRLEMGTKLENPRGKNLYDFWGERITDVINETLSTHKEKVLLNLASNEYFKSVKKKNIDARLLTCVFKDWKASPSDAKVISFLAKQARGQMTRFIIDNRIDSVDDLRDFNVGGYAFKKKLSTENEWVFTRKFIPVAQKK